MTPCEYDSSSQDLNCTNGSKWFWIDSDRTNRDTDHMLCRMHSPVPLPPVIDQELEDLRTKLNDAKFYLGFAQEGYSGLKAHVSKVEENMSNLQEDLDNANGHVTQLLEKLGDHKGTVEDKE